jgi:histone acetyltransferase (RNA polymerase elongator complex component)
MDTRWTIKVSEETDRDLRTYLAQRGLKKGDLSKFVEEAVREQLFRNALAETRAANRDLSEYEAMALADEAVSWARREASAR